MERVEDPDDRINCIECRNSCKCPVARLRCGRFRPITGVEPPWLERMRRREIVEIANALHGVDPGARGSVAGGGWWMWVAW